MKKYYFIIWLALIAGKSFSQNANTIFLTYSLSRPDPVYRSGMVGGAGYKALASNSFGVRYYLKSQKIITLETGIEYNDFQCKLDYVGHPDVIIPDITQHIRIISIPLYAHLTFLKYCFINGGAILDSEINKKGGDIDKQSGIGLGLGIGLKYTYKKISIFVNPFFERHALFSLAGKENRGNQSTINPGGRIGIGYSF